MECVAAMHVHCVPTTMFSASVVAAAILCMMAMVSALFVRVSLAGNGTWEPVAGARRSSGMCCQVLSAGGVSGMTRGQARGSTNDKVVKLDFHRLSVCLGWLHRDNLVSDCRGSAMHSTKRGTKVLLCALVVSPGPERERGEGGFCDE